LSKLTRLTAQEAERLLLDNGYKYVRSKGSHRIYIKDVKRIIIPFHSKKILHPKIVKQVYRAIEKHK